jgi:hypothetical protein
MDQEKAMFQNKVIVNLALLFAFTGAAVGSLTLWKITTQSESFLSTTSPKGTYTVRLTGRKDRPKVPFLNHQVLFSVSREEKVVVANRYLHSGTGVYGHILLSAGTMLIQQSGDPGGWAAHQANRFKDWAQAVRVSDQYPSERAGNIAGREVGTQLWDYIKGRLTGEGLINNLRRELCGSGS